jgi:hypothetical protein
MDMYSEPVGSRRLLDMSLSTIQRNIACLEDLGDTPLHLATRILRYIKRPQQLAIIEENSPTLLGHTHEFWFNFIKRDIFNWEKMLLTKQKRDGSFWTAEEIKQKATYKTYKNCLQKAEDEERKAREILNKDMQARKETDIDTETKILEKEPSTWTKGRSGNKRTTGTVGGLRFTHGSRTKTDTPKGFMAKLRREAADSKLTRPGSTLATPNHLLGRTPPMKIFARREIEKTTATTPISATQSTRTNYVGNTPQKPLSSIPAIPANTESNKPVPQTSPLRPGKRKAPPTVLLPNKRQK